MRELTDVGCGKLAHDWNLANVALADIVQKKILEALQRHLDDSLLVEIFRLRGAHQVADDLLCEDAQDFFDVSEADKLGHSIIRWQILKLQW